MRDNFTYFNNFFIIYARWSIGLPGILPFMASGTADATGPAVCPSALIQQFLIGSLERVPDCPKLLQLYVLNASLNFDETFPCDWNALQVHHPHKLHLADSLAFSDSSDIHPNCTICILFYLLFHYTTLSEPKSVHFCIYFMRKLCYNGTENSPFMEMQDLKRRRMICSSICGNLSLLFLKLSNMLFYKNLKLPVCRSRIVFCNVTKLSHGFII